MLDDEEEKEVQEVFDGTMKFDYEEATPQISINAMLGNSGFNAMRVNGHIGKKILHIPIDSGSPHNFLNEQMARKLGCKLEPITKQCVAIANGNSMQC